MSKSGKSYRVGVDGYNLAIPRGTGVATYARSLSVCLRQLGHPIDVLYGMDIDPASEPVMRQVAFFEQLQTERGYRRPRYPSLQWGRAMARAWRGDAAVDVPVDGRVVVEPVADRLPEYDRLLNARNLFGVSAHYFQVFKRLMPIRIANPPAIMHWTYPVAVTLEGAHNIYTVHDLVPLRMPYATLDNKPAYRRLLAQCIKQGDQICTVSESSLADIVSFFPDTPTDRVTNSYQAIVAPPAPLDRDQAARLLQDGFQLEFGRYFLFFGSIEPKKNVGRLLQAYLASDCTIPLVIVAARTWHAEGEAAILGSAELSSARVRQIAYVPRTMLSVLVQGARAVTFPSLYEGFGLPVLEAMQLGTPVLTTREGSLKEIAGDAALFVDAYDIRSIADGLQRLASDDVLCADLQRRGFAQVERFSMAQYQGRVQAMYETVLARPRRNAGG